jgi:hypothetical protein
VTGGLATAAMEHLVGGDLRGQGQHAARLLAAGLWGYWGELREFWLAVRSSTFTQLPAAAMAEGCNGGMVVMQGGQRASMAREHGGGQMGRCPGAFCWAFCRACQEARRTTHGASPVSVQRRMRLELPGATANARPSTSFFSFFFSLDALYCTPWVRCGCGCEGECTSSVPSEVVAAGLLRCCAAALLLA